MSKIILFDFEVFKNDVLLGTMILDNDKKEVFQTWDEDEIREFYELHKDDVWMGWNIKEYDYAILDAIVRKRSPYETSYKIIELNERVFPKTKLYYYDLIDAYYTKFSLKATECVSGKNISESEVDFNLDRYLTDEEKRLTESYNRDDLNQTYYNYTKLKHIFELRVGIIKEFGLSLDCLHITGAQLAAIVLGAKPIPGIEYQLIKPPIYPQLQLKNKDVWDYYLSEGFRKNEKRDVYICGIKHNLASGGLHGARENCNYDWAYYFDVSGYYNLVMINLDLLPRSIGESGKQMYQHLYDEVQYMKKTKDPKRNFYKPILLAVFGAMNNEYTKFYDPQKALLVTMSGELFIIDLLEKLEGKIDLIQTNTDGIIAKPLAGQEEKVVEIINEWQKRTNFVLKLEKIYNIWQRDVNNYFFQNEDGSVHVKGEAVKFYEQWDNPFVVGAVYFKEPIITHYMIVDYLLYDKTPEETLEKYKKELRMFQYCCRKQSYDYLELQSNYTNGELKITKLQNINRVFASNNKKVINMVYKCRKSGKTKRAKVSNLPDNVFVYNDTINVPEAYEKLKDKIDWQYYINRGYERICEFVGCDNINVEEGTYKQLSLLDDYE